MASSEHQSKSWDNSGQRNHHVSGEEEASNEEAPELLPVSSSHPALEDGASLPHYAPGDSSLMAKMSLNEADIHRWQASTEFETEATNEGKIQALFNACVGYYSLLLRALLGHERLVNYEKKELERNLRLLQVWGESYAVSEGHLDGLEIEAVDVAETIMMFLLEISVILIRKIPRLIGKWKFEENESLLHAQEYLERQMANLQDSDADSAFDINESDPETGENDNSMQQCLEDMQEYVQLLNELHPSIESCLSLIDDHIAPTLDEAKDRGAYLFFSDIVRSRFTGISEPLAEVLGMLNLERYNRMATAREINLTISENLDEVESVAPKTESFQDSGLGSSLPSTALPSIGVPSIFSALAGKSRSRLPPLPTTTSSSQFTCDYCGKKVWFQNKRDWHKHLIQDLQPYSCLDSTCPWSKHALPGRDEFIDHLAHHHGMAPDWNPQFCGLCHTLTEAGKLNVCKHFADHLEDIAIAASPLNLTSEDGSDADSDKSHGHEHVNDDLLPPINEVDEEEQNTRSDRQTPSMDDAPNCAICDAPAYPECPHESERLQIAVKQAEERAMAPRLKEVRVWVITHARQHILNAFTRLTDERKRAHATYLSSLPNYSIYMQYSGHPPVHPAYVAQLQAQISKAHAELKRDIDADWRASVLRYPEVLDYFYSLVAHRLPDERSPRVVQPPLDGLRELNKPMKKKRRHVSPPDITTLDFADRLRGPPRVPTPPIVGGTPISRENP